MAKRKKIRKISQKHLFVLAYQVSGSKNVAAKLCQAPQGRFAKQNLFHPRNEPRFHSSPTREKADTGEKGEELLSPMTPSTYGPKHPSDVKLYIMTFFFF